MVGRTGERLRLTGASTGIGSTASASSTSWAPFASSGPMRPTRSRSPCSWADESARPVRSCRGSSSWRPRDGRPCRRRGHRPLACQNVRLLCAHARLKIGHAGRWPRQGTLDRRASTRADRRQPLSPQRRLKPRSARKPQRETAMSLPWLSPSAKTRQLRTGTVSCSRARAI
jgi:hypothetical protein